MARMSEFTFLSSDGQTALSAREYLPEGDPVGIVQIVHGIAEHIARYDAFAAFLAEHGYIVVLHDQLGHGKSAPDEAHLGFFSEENGWEKAVQDIRSLHDKTAAKYPGKPYFIFGHSMGSFIAREFAAAYGNSLTAVVFMGTSAGISTAMWKAERTYLNMLKKAKGARAKIPSLEKIATGPYNKKFKPNRTNYDWVTSKEEEAASRSRCRGISTSARFCTLSTPTNGTAVCRKTCRFCSSPAKTIPWAIWARACAVCLIN